MERFGARRGLGIDIDEEKIENTREAGFEAISADARELNLDRQVSFVAMLDFFEHLPDRDCVFDILAAAARSARDFIYIKHPSFEGEERVEAMGLRQYWWDWHGHTAHIRIAEYCTMFDELGLSSYKIRFLERIADSSHSSIIPTSMPRDQSATSAAKVSDLPWVEFSPPLWRRQDIFVALRPFSETEWESITRPTANDLKMMRDGGQLRDPENIPMHLRPMKSKKDLRPEPAGSPRNP